MNGLLIGCRDYDHPGWTPEPFPPELPPDWRLTYYSNALSSVLVSARGCASLDRERAAAWRDDVGPDFRFVLEIDPWSPELDPGSGWQQFASRLEPLLGKTWALITSREAPVSWLRACAGYAAMPVCAPAGEVGWNDRVWRPRDEPPPVSTQGALVALLPDGNPRELRMVIERLAQQECAHTGLFFTDPAHAWRVAMQARQLADLMGGPTGV